MRSEDSTEKYDDALKYNTCCLSCYASEFGLASANRYSPYRNRAYIYQKMGLKDSAFCCMDSLFLSHQLKSVSMETVAGHYVQRGLLYANFDEYGLAIADYKYADSLLSVRYPEDSNSRMHICWLWPIVGIIKKILLSLKRIIPIIQFCVNLNMEISLWSMQIHFTI